MALCLLLCCLFMMGFIACTQKECTDADAGKTGSDGKVYKFTSDTSYYYFTSHEGKFVSNTDYLFEPNLKNLPLHLGNWEGENLDVNDPNILYMRYYRNSETKKVVYFIAVNGTNESKFHTPEVCYIGGGWKIGERWFKSLDLRGEKFEVRYAIATRGEFRHLILYWYIWPDSRRINTNGMTMFRISVRIDSTVEDAEQAAVDFIGQLSLARVDIKKGKEEPPIPVFVPQTVPGKKVIASKFSPNKEKALNWLKGQIVPNGIVSEPAEDRRYLLVSYRVPQDAEDYKYIFSKASMYDNALAIIAFTMAGEMNLAERVIEAASRILSPDGDLWFTFNTHNSWPNEQDHQGAIVRSGASAWLGYATLYYLQTRLIYNPGLFQSDSQAIAFLKIARSIADKLLSRQIMDKGDPRYGFFTGGEGRYEYKWNAENKKVEEVFVPGKVEWVSIEHNIDIYFFYRDLALLTGDKKYESSAELLKQSLLTKAWNDKIRQFNRGVRLNGPDEARALDCASWGSMFLWSVGDDSKANVALGSTKNYFVKSGRFEGYKPYIDLLIYDEPQINALFYPNQPDKNWNDIPMIWPEGSLGVAMSKIRMGKIDDAERIISDIVKLQDKDGGLPCSTEGVLYQFSKNPSVAGTSWLVMTVSVLEDERARYLFWGH